MHLLSYILFSIFFKGKGLFQLSSYLQLIMEGMSQLQEFEEADWLYVPLCYGMTGCAIKTWLLFLHHVC